jgi:hypothetical protein
MGLDIIIQRDKNDEDSTEGLFRIGYGSYHRLMEEIAKFFQLDIADKFYSSDNNYCPEIDLDKLIEFKDQKDFQFYENIVQNAGDKKVLIPLLMHSDCDGSIPVKLLKDMIPLLDTDEIKLWFRLSSEWDYQFFNLVDAIKTAVDAGCDFIYA